MLSLSVFLFVAFLVIFLGGVVFVHDPRNPTNRWFLAWTFCAVAWMVANFLENVSAIPFRDREMLLRVDFFFGIVAAAAVVMFAFRFVGRKPSRTALPAIILFPLALGLASFGSLVLQSISLAPNGEIKYGEGALYDVYALCTLGYYIWSCVILFYKRRASPPAVRAQRAVVGTGLAITTIIAAVVNLFLQNVWPADLLRIGIYGFLVFVVSVTWAITRHEFLRIRFVAVEILFLGILSTLLTRAIVSVSVEETIINIVSFLILLILGFAMIRSFLNEEIQRQKAQALSETLAVANERLKAMDQLKSEFISIASHQLRTPISVMKGYLSLMLEGAYGEQPKQAAEKVEHMYEMNERLVQMVSNMLNVSRMEKSKLDYFCAPTDIAALAAEAVDDMRIKAKQGNVTLAYAKPAAKLEAFVDKEKITEVFSNLLDNAIKYSPKGGKIALTVAPYRRGEEVMVTVKDEGLGMTAEQAAHLFQKYYRVKSDATQAISGTGLGLYVCLMFVEGMGGKIWIDKTAPGKGTTFAFVLPTRAKQQCALPPKKTAPQAAA